MADAGRRLIAFVLFGVSLVLLMGALLLVSGHVELGNGLETTMAVLLGGAGVADLALGAYFLVTA